MSQTNLWGKQSGEKYDWDPLTNPIALAPFPECTYLLSADLSLDSVDFANTVLNESTTFGLAKGTPTASLDGERLQTVVNTEHRRCVSGAMLQ